MRWESCCCLITWVIKEQSGETIMLSKMLCLRIVVPVGRNFMKSPKHKVSDERSCAFLSFGPFGRPMACMTHLRGDGLGKLGIIGGF